MNKYFKKIRNRLISDKTYQDFISKFPNNYEFEFLKCITKISEIQFNLSSKNECRKARVGIQFPDGLLPISMSISALFELFTNSDCFIIAENNYGACCIQDTISYSLGLDILIHYG